MASDSGGRRGHLRRDYIDWLRGIAVLLMIMWHAIDSWHETANRGTGAFLTAAFLAGWAAPLFLFLAGLSLALAGTSRVEAGGNRAQVARALAKRGWQVFLLAHLFRLQSFLLNPNASWSALLKPDILNILGLGLVASAYLWARAVGVRQQMLWLLGPAAVVAFVLTPLAPTWWWPTLLYPRFEAYIRPVGNQGQFSLFPATAFIFDGAFAGALLGAYDRVSEGRYHRRAALIGLGLVCAGGLLDAAPGLAAVRWLQPAAVVTWRAGAMTLLLALAWWWLARAGSPGRHHPLMVFGQTSLFVYFVHVEVAYGWVSSPLWKSLSMPWAVWAYAVLTVAMYGAAVLWRRRPSGALIPAHLIPPRESTSLGRLQP